MNSGRIAVPIPRSLADHPVVRVAVAAGTDLVCDAFSARLASEEGLHARGVPGDLTAAVQAAAAFGPDVVVFDTAIARGVEAPFVDLITALPTAPVIVALLAPGETALAVHLLEIGVRAAVLKSASSDELVAAVHWASRGMGWVSPPLLHAVLATFRAGAPGVRRDQLSPLSTRELEVLQLLVDGLGRREIAEILYLSIETVRTHLCTILNKLDVHSAIGAAAVGRQAGLRPTRSQPRTIAAMR